MLQTPLEQAFKQFYLETERLESIYQHLQTQFKDIHSQLQESHLNQSGKLAELAFVSNYLETILHHISQGIIFIDLNGIVTTYNLEAQQLLKIEGKKLLFHPFNDFFKDDQLGFSLQQALRSKQCPKMTLVSLKQAEQQLDLEVEATFVTLNQPSYSAQFSSSLEANAQQPIQGLLILLRNLTEIRRLQLMADRYSRLKELGELAAHLAHEIRNPLGGIKGFGALLQQELHDRPDLQQMATYIVQGADDLNQLVTNILTYARPCQTHLEMVECVSFLEGIRQGMQADSSWNPAIEFTIYSSKPSIIVPLDPQLLKSALLNLFINARQAMPQGGKLSVHLEETQEALLLKINDTGTGIAPEHVPHIFSPFFTTKHQGNGLGLAEVQKAIQAHQGWIDVQSEQGKGTTFTIKLPLKIGV